jgi:hypothetical protein
MDEVVAKPETFGLPRNWSAGMMGMMTLVRVLPDREYHQIMEMENSKSPEDQHEDHSS